MMIIKLSVCNNNTQTSSKVMGMILLLLLSLMASRSSASLVPTHHTISVVRDYYANNNKSSSTILSQMYNIRGGGDGEDASSPPYEPSYNYAHPQQQQQQQPPPQLDGAAGLSPTEPLASSSSEYNTNPSYEYRETVEDRIDAWRRQQQQMQQTQSATDAASAIDEQGRFKLFTTVSRVSVSFFFFILMWRTVHHYELADAAFGTRSSSQGGGVRASLLRIVVVTPLIVLFLGEMMGAILGLYGGNTASHATKKRLKGILNLHKGIELIMMVYNVIRLAILPSKYVMREVYIGRTISNFFFLMQAQLYTKLSWDDVSKSTIGEGGYATESYYDDYTPEMSIGNYGDDESTTTTPWASTTTSGGSEYYGQQAANQSSQQQRYEPNYDENSAGWNSQP